MIRFIDLFQSYNQKTHAHQKNTKCCESNFLHVFTEIRFPSSALLVAYSGNLLGEDPVVLPVQDEVEPEIHLVEFAHQHCEVI